MRSRKCLSSFWLLVFVLVVVTRASGGPDSGAVVESVTTGLEGDAAGLRPGDTILSWMRGAARGPVASELDLLAVEIEQAPRGLVTLEGIREGEPRRWILGPRDWSIQSRPVLPEPALDLYRHGQQLAKEGRPREAGGCWKAAADQLPTAGYRQAAAWLLYRAGQTLAAAAQWSEADAAYTRALENADEPAIQSLLLRLWAVTFQERDLEQAKALGQRSTARAEDLGPDALTRAAGLNFLGVVDRDPEKAEGYLRRALEIRQTQAPNSLPVASTLNNLGLAAAKRGDLEKAESDHLRALAIREELAPNSVLVAASLNALGTVAGERDDLARAEDYVRRSLVIIEKAMPGTVSISRRLMNLGILAQRRGGWAEAESLYYRALAIQEKLPPGPDLADILEHLGVVAKDQGDLRGAEEHTRRALAIQQELAPESLAVAELLDTLGALLHARGDAAGAQEHLSRALAIKERHAPGSLTLAKSLVNLGDMRAERGDRAAAETGYRQALELQEKQAPNSLHVAESLHHLGELMDKGGSVDQAEAFFQRALRIRVVLAPESAAHAETAAALARIARRQGRLEAARQLFEEALDAVEHQAALFGGDQELRVNFRAQHNSYYTDYTELLLTLKLPEQAFQVLERSRARALLETLLTARVDVRNGVDPALLQKQRILQRSLDAKRTRSLQIEGSPQAQELGREIDDLLGESRGVERRIRASSPAYAALARPVPLSTTAIQHLLDADTLLLEYELGDESSRLWLLSSSALTIHPLPKRADVETAARTVYGLLTARNRYNKDESDGHRMLRLAKADAEYPRAAATLGRMILGPVASLLQHKRLLIVSDGVLQYLPFGALPLPTDAAATAEATPLVVAHEIVGLPSATILQGLRRKAVPRKHPMRVAVLADPVFDAKDVRVSGVEASNGSQTATRSASETDERQAPGAELEAVALRSAAHASGAEGETHFPRLPFTRLEAQAILGAAGAGHSLCALDFAANRETATSPDLARYQILHFATHGAFNSEEPELSGLILSLVDARGRQQSGFLGLRTIYGLTLPAELVVLSGCETGLGKAIQGEGLLGLTRGFLHAGAAGVISSLWKVDDAATAELMRRLYNGMLKEGMSPAAALRKAQVALWRQSPRKSPYYWAGFVMQGQW